MTPSTGASEGAREPARAVATFAGGCFWCTEAVFSELEGVDRVIPGYTGGATPHPSYEQVCTGETGHAEAIELTYRPDRISYRDLLVVFFTTHDPTTRDRQGNDVGTQYRSAVFYRTPEEKATAEAVVRELEAEKVFRHPVVTEIVPLQVFYPAEEYHHDYYRKNPERGYCQAVIAPKLSKFRKEHAAQLRSRETAALPLPPRGAT
jgi:peptide-methionine (S)-S-oxide reductase